MFTCSLKNSSEAYIVFLVFASADDETVCNSVYIVNVSNNNVL